MKLYERLKELRTERQLTLKNLRNVPNYLCHTYRILSADVPLPCHAGNIDKRFDGDGLPVEGYFAGGSQISLPAGLAALRDDQPMARSLRRNGSDLEQIKWSKRLTQKTIGLMLFLQLKRILGNSLIARVTADRSASNRPSNSLVARWISWSSYHRF